MTTTTGLNYFSPDRQYISAMTPMGFYTQITTVNPHNYLAGLTVRLVYPESFGMTGLINQVFPIIIIDASNFIVPYDSSSETPFAIPAGADQPAEVIPVGEDALTLRNAVQNGGTSLPEYGWTNTTFPWVNLP